MNKKFLVSVLVPILLLAFLFNSSTNIQMVFASPADAYGNDINWIVVYQWNGTDYVLMHNITSSGGTYRIFDSQATKFVVNIKFNDTLASSDAEAISFTAVYMNITGVWNNEELNNTVCTSSGGFYWLEEEGIWNIANQPEAGETYECSVLYQGYY